MPDSNSAGQRGHFDVFMIKMDHGIEDRKFWVGFWIFTREIYIYIIYILRQDFFEVDFGTFTLQKLPLRQVMSLKSMVHVRLYSRNNPWNFETILRGVQKSTFCDAIHRIWLKLRDDSVNNPNDIYIYIYITNLKIRNRISCKTCH